LEDRLSIGLLHLDVRHGRADENRAALAAYAEEAAQAGAQMIAAPKLAVSGSPSRTNIFDTPWGRMGVLICADSFHGLLRRAKGEASSG